MPELLAACLPSPSAGSACPNPQRPNKLTGSARGSIIVLTVRFAHLATLSASLALATCVGCSDSSESTPAGTSSSGVAYARAQIEKATAVPTFRAPGPGFDASAARGKRVFVIPYTSAIPFLKEINDSMVEVGKRYGVKVTVYNNQGQPSQWVQGLNQAIAQQASAIILGAPPEQLGPQLKQAKAAGIPVNVLHLYDRVMPRPRDVTSTVFAPFTKAARLEADWVIMDTEGKANAVIITDNTVPPSRYIVSAMQAEFRAHCPGCDTKIIDVPAPDWGTKMQPATQSALLADPGVNYLIPIYDSMSQFAIPGIVAAGRSGEVKIASYNGTPFVLNDIRTENTVAMDVGESQDWLGHANMDQVMRMITGHKPLPDVETPIRVFNQSNIAEAGNPPDPNRAFGSSYVSGYRTVWSGE
jgi:ribose transport system substrate-binding protein